MQDEHEQYKLPYSTVMDMWLRSELHEFALENPELPDMTDMSGVTTIN